MYRRSTNAPPIERLPARLSGSPRRAHPRTRALRSGRAATTMALVVLALFLSACGINATEPRAPEPVTAVTTTPGVGLITVAWEDNSTFETGFIVSRKTVQVAGPAAVENEPENGVFVEIAMVDANVTTYEDRDVILGAEYRYSVTATNGDAAADAVEPEAPEPVEVLNGAPVAESQSVTVAEDGSVAITLTGTDPEGAVLGFVLVSEPAHGKLTGTAPNLVYTPAADYHGSDAFTFRVSDGETDSAVATLSIDVQPENDTPVAEPQTLATEEDAPLSIELTGTDLEGAELTYAVATQPSSGSLTGAGSSWTYVPASDFHGMDAFSFTVSDGQDSSVAATVTIDVVAMPDAPVFTSEPKTSVQEDDAYVYEIHAADADGDAVAFSVAQKPSWLEFVDHGAGTATLSSIVGHPSNEDVGSGYAVELVVDDGTGRTATQSFTLSVVNTNDAPTIDQGETMDISVQEDATSAPVTLTAVDADAGDTLAWSLATAPSFGTVDVTGDGTFAYAGHKDYFGADAFVVKVSDGTAHDTITVHVTVENEQDLPIAFDDAFTTAEDTTLHGNVLSQVDGDGGFDYDPDGDPIHVVDSDLGHEGVDPVSGPSHGILMLMATGEFSYLPNPNYSGSDAFVYAIRDHNSGENVLATVSLEITPVDDSPVITQGESAPIVVDEEALSAPLALTATDVEGDALVWSVESQPEYGTANVDANGHVTYTGDLDFAGHDGFVVAVTAGDAKDTITVAVTVHNVNDAPILDQGEDASISTDEDVTSAPVTLSVTDVDAGDAHVWSIGTPAVHGTAHVDASGNVTYVGGSDFNGSDAFAVVVSDGAGAHDSIAFNVTVAPVADAPTVGHDTGTVRYDAVLMTVDLASGGTTSSLLTNDVDADGDAIRVGLFDTTSAMGASVNVVSNGQFSYDPRGVATFETCGVHQDSFAYTVKDETGLETEGTVAVTVLSNCPPTDLVLSSVHVPENEPVGTFVGDFAALDPNDGDAHTFALVAGEGDADNASFTISGTSLRTNAAFDFETRSLYSIRVRADDGRGGIYEEAFTIAVVDVSECPPFPTDTRKISFDGSAPWSGTLDLGGAYEYVLPESKLVTLQFGSPSADFTITVVESDGCVRYSYDAMAGVGYGTSWTMPMGAHAIILTPADGQIGSVDIALTPN